MKTMSCDLCEKEFSGNTFEEWFEQMKVHYMKDHSDFMVQNKYKPREEGMKWMVIMKEKFDSL